MGRLRLGDIEMDEHGIRIAGMQMPASPAPQTSLVRIPPHLPPAPRPAEQALAPVPARDGLEVLEGLPVRSSIIVVGGVTVATAGGVAMAFALAAHSLALLLGGGGLLFFGIGAGLLGVIRWASLRQRDRRRQAEAAARLEPILDRLRAALAPRPDGKETEQTLEWLIERSGVAEADAVRALVALRDRGEIQEELDQDNGNWYYQRAVGEAPAARNLDLDSRLAELQKGRNP